MLETTRTLEYNFVKMTVTIEDDIVRDVMVGDQDIAHILSEEVCDEIYQLFLRGDEDGNDTTTARTC
jgi:hypothetical protein